MESSRVQWLQKMGIEVWRVRTVDRVPTDGLPNEFSNQPLVQDYRSTRKNLKSTRVDPSLDKTGSSPTEVLHAPARDEQSNSTERVQIEVNCVIGAELLLIKDKDALDRDFTDDVFRAYHMLKNKDTQSSDVSFFRFNWPANTLVRSVKSASDTTLDGARRAFVAKTRSMQKKLPKYVVAFGQQSVQLTDGGAFDKQSILHLLADHSTISAKTALWTFLRDDT